MRYVCLVYIDEQAVDDLPCGDFDRLAADTIACEERMRREGRFIFSETLQGVRTATTVRRRNGRLLIGDGPVVAERAPLRALLVIEARDLDDAMQVASSLPHASLGSVEVRPVAARTHLFVQS